MPGFDRQNPQRSPRRALHRSSRWLLACPLLFLGSLALQAAFDPGDKRWEFATGASVRSSPALGTNGLLYVASYDRKLYAPETATGAKRWEFLTQDILETSPVIGEDGTVYLGCFDGRFYAVDGSTGQAKWRQTFCVQVSEDLEHRTPLGACPLPDPPQIVITDTSALTAARRFDRAIPLEPGQTECPP